MTETNIHIDHVWKEYTRGTTSSYLRLSELLTRLPGRLLRRSSADPEHQTSQTFWALQDIDFAVREGEVLGLIGHNGAGKSTLLKILSRITAATRGRVGVRGQVGSLLEVGTGFHPELTGRENVFLNGSLLGMKRTRIRDRLDEIIEFAEVADAIDTPVKYYSSGMYVRLAFSVAAHLEPSVLLVDEVLAVGDAKFQRRCLGKLKDISLTGRTILFVSHNMAAITGLCTRAVLLKSGRLVADGAPAEVVGRYLSAASEERFEAHFEDDPRAESEKLRLHEVRIDPDADHDNVLTVRTPFTISTTFTVTADVGRPNVSLFLYNAQGICLFNTISPLFDEGSGTYTAVVQIPGDLLNNGLHRLRVLLATDLVVGIDYDNALTFTVQDTDRPVPVFGEWQGAVRVQLPWSRARES